jgi:hypothetical protein
MVVNQSLCFDHLRGDDEVSIDAGVTHYVKVCSGSIRVRYYREYNYAAC